jgi:hypothetical protein
VFLVQLAGEPAAFDAGSLFEDGRPGGRQPEPAAAKASGAAAAHDEDVPTTSGLMDGISGLPTDPDDSSVVEFDFDFEDDEDDQPPL